MSFQQGVQLHKSGDYRGAIQRFSAALHNPRSNREKCAVYHWRGISYHRLKRYELAIDDYNKAIELDPYNATIYSNRGNSYRAFKRHELAVVDYGKAIELDPNDAVCYNNRGYTYRVLGQHDLAVADYCEAIDLDASKAKYFYRRGDSYMKLKLYELAVVDLSKAVEMEPENVAFREQHEFAERELERPPNIAMEPINELRQQINEMNEKHNALLIEIGEKSCRLDELIVKFRKERDLKERLEVENNRLRTEVEKLRAKLAKNEQSPVSVIVNRVVNSVASHRPTLSRLQIESDKQSLQLVIPQVFSAIVGCGSIVMGDTELKLPKYAQLADIDALYREWCRLQESIGSYTRNEEDQLPLSDITSARDECEQKFLHLMDVLCGEFGCTYDTESSRGVQQARKIVQRMLRAHKSLLADSSVISSASSPSPSPPSELSVPDLCGRMRSIVDSWMSKYVELRIGIQNEAARECETLAYVLERLSEYAGDVSAVVLPSVSFGDELENAIRRLVSLFDQQDTYLTDYGRLFPQDACENVYTDLCEVVRSRVRVLTRVSDVLAKCGEVYSVLKRRSRVEYIEELRSEHKSVVRAKKKARRAVEFARHALEDGEDDDDPDEEELKKLRVTLEEAKSCERLSGNAYFSSMIARLLEVLKYAPELLVSCEFDNDKCAQTLREANTSEGLVRADITLDSFDEEPQVIAAPPMSRHTVFRGTLNGVTYALKQFSTNDGSKLMREVRIMKRLKHPYVAKVAFVVVDHRSRLFYQATPFYGGGSLEHLLRDFHQRGERMDDGLLKHLMRQLLLGVAHIHSRGIIHCDLKPDNIFLSVVLSSGDVLTVKIGDFDVSKSDEQRATYVATMVTVEQSGYTPEYVAPELLEQGSKPTTKSDMYSVGACMLHMMCGSRAERPPPPYTLESLGHFFADRRLDDDLLRVLCVLLAESPCDRMSASEVLALPYFAESDVKLRRQLDEKEKRERENLGRAFRCCVCFVDVYEANGVTCPSCDESHFLCDECLNDKVMFESNVHDNTNLERREARIFCVGYSTKDNECHESNNPRPYDDNVLAKHVKPETFEKYMKARIELLEVRIESEAAEEVKRQVKVQVEELKRVDNHNRVVHEACEHIIDNLLTLKCTNPSGCDQAFVDFRDCFALECSRCRGSFCGWCLEWCAKDAHPHVLRCSKSLVENEVYGTPELFEEANRRRRTSDVMLYLISLANNTGEVARDVVRSIEPQLRALQLDDIIHRFS